MLVQACLNRHIDLNNSRRISQEMVGKSDHFVQQRCKRRNFQVRTGNSTVAKILPRIKLVGPFLSILGEGAYEGFCFIADG